MTRTEKSRVIPTRLIAKLPQKHEKADANRILSIDFQGSSPNRLVFKIRAVLIIRAMRQKKVVAVVITAIANKDGK